MIDNLKDLKAVLDSTGIPTVYYEYAENAAPDPPYLVYYEGKSVTFFADDEPYLTRTPIAVELYTTKKDPDLEQKVSSALTAAGLLFEKDQAFFDEEQLYEISFDTEIFENNNSKENESEA